MRLSLHKSLNTQFAGELYKPGSCLDKKQVCLFLFKEDEYYTIQRLWMDLHKTMQWQIFQKEQDKKPSQCET